MSDSIHTILCNKKISLTVKGKIAQITVRKRCNPSAFLVFLLLTKAGLNCPNLRLTGVFFPHIIHLATVKCQTWIGEKGPRPSAIYWERSQWKLFFVRWFAMHGCKQSWLQHPMVASFLRKTITKVLKKKFKTDSMSQFTIWDLVSPPLIRGRWALLSSRTWSILPPTRQDQTWGTWDDFCLFL